MTKTIDDLNRNFTDFLKKEEQLFASKSKGDMQMDLKVLAELIHREKESESRKNLREKSL